MIIWLSLFPAANVILAAAVTTNEIAAWMIFMVVILYLVESISFHKVTY